VTAEVGGSPPRVRIALDALIEARIAERGGEVEAIRLADLVDLSGCLLAFGLDRRWLHTLNDAVPRRGLAGELIREVGRALRERPMTVPRIFWRS
jgi:hypothetical protein